MSETPAQAFCRIRLERGDSWAELGELMHVSANAVYTSAFQLGRVPKRWLRLVPDEYRGAVIDAMIAELERMKPQTLGSGASGSDRDSGEL